MSQEGFVMNGAGPVKLAEHVHELAQIPEISAIVVGSITLLPRQGNEGNTFYMDPEGRFSLNSKGLPNPGLAYYEDHLTNMVEEAHVNGKLLIVSVAGFSPEEYALLADSVIRHGADGVELNLGCPNALGENGQQKAIASFYPTLIRDIIASVEQTIGTSHWVSAKISPFSNPAQLSEIGLLLANSQLIKAVVTSNTFPNAFAFNEEGVKAIDPQDGLGGMAGPALMPIALGQVRQLRSLLPEGKLLIGVGGIATPQNANAFLSAGADGIQATTAYVESGIFPRLRKSRL